MRSSFQWLTTFILIPLVMWGALSLGGNWTDVVTIDTLIGLRTFLYVVTMILVVLLGKLNDTSSESPKWYVRALLCLFPLVAGALLYILGDTVHSLYIFSGLSVLLVLLSKPRGLHKPVL